MSPHADQTIESVATASTSADPTAAIDRPEPWMQALADAFEHFAYGVDQPGDQQFAARIATWKSEYGPAAEFLHLVAPLIRRGCRELHLRTDRLYAVLGESQQACRASDLMPLLLANLIPQLLNMLARTSVVELHASRSRGELWGATREDRFESFIGLLQNPEFAFDILARYPLLARQSVVAVENWVTASDRFATDLLSDWNSIQNQFFPDESPGALVAVDGSAGDRHRRGRSVLVLRFASGAHLLYKPRSLAVDRHFQELIEWLNARASNPRLSVLKLLDRGDHGWVEFVEHQKCHSQAEVARFYRRQGSLLALLYLVSATDVHFENLIAHGEHPVLIDLEALFHQSLPGLRKDAAALGLTASVLTVRMLPQATYVEGLTEPVDFSGLGAASGQVTPFRAPAWVNTGTDEMRLTVAAAQTPAGHHQPSTEGAAVDFRDFQADFIAGFQSAYHILQAHRDELIGKEGPLARFADDEIRYIVRPTQVYSIVLEQSLHPQRLAFGDMRESLFARLEARVADFPCLAQLIETEREDLEQNDIPLFTAKAGSRHLWASSGACVKDFFAQPALEQVTARAAALGDDDLARQLWCIEAAFALSASSPSQPAAPDYTPPATQSDALAAATRCADQLLSLAYRYNGDVGWLGLHARERGWSIGPLGVDVADGLSGIALFLMHLGRQTGEVRYRQSAREIAHAIFERRMWDADLRRAVADSGQANGLIWALEQIGEASGEARLIERAAQLAADFQIAAHELPAVALANLAETTAIVEGFTALASPRSPRIPPAAVTSVSMRQGLAGFGLRMLYQAAGVI